MQTTLSQGTSYISACLHPSAARHSSHTALSSRPPTSELTSVGFKVLCKWYSEAHLWRALHKDHEGRRLFRRALHCRHCAGQLSMTHGDRNTRGTAAAGALFISQNERTPCCTSTLSVCHPVQSAMWLSGCGSAPCMRFCSFSALRMRCSLALLRDLFRKALGLRFISAVGASSLPLSFFFCSTPQTSEADSFRLACHILPCGQADLCCPCQLLGQHQCHSPSCPAGSHFRGCT